MAPRPGTEAMSSVLLALSLVASALTLAGGMYAARAFYRAQTPDSVDVGVWGDDAQDRILVVSGEQGADWTQLEVRTDRPARVTLGGAASRHSGTISPGSGFVALSATPQQVVGGDTLSICAVAQAGPMEVTLRDGVSHAVLFQQTMDVARCASGNGAQPTPTDDPGSPGRSDPQGGGRGNGRGNGRD